MKIKEKVKNGKNAVVNWFVDNVEPICIGTGIVIAGATGLVFGYLIGEEGCLTKQLLADVRRQGRDEGCHAVEIYAKTYVPEAYELINEDLKTRKDNEFLRLKD